MSKKRPKDQYIQVGDINTRYWVHGNGKSTIILIHGLGGYVENWEDNIAELAQYHQVCALDLPGFGRSDKPHVRYTIQYLTEFVKEFMILKEIDKAVLIGESLGGAIALQFVLQYPQWVEKLVLAASGGLGKEVAIILRIMTIPILGDLLSKPSREGSAQLMRELFYNQDLVVNDWIEEDFEMSSLDGAQRCLLSALRSFCNIRGVKRDVYLPILNRLENIEVPTLILWGAQDKILPVEHAHQSVKKLPNGKLHIFDPCGHVPNIECAEEFNLQVQNFLKND